MSGFAELNQTYTFHIYWIAGAPHLDFLFLLDISPCALFLHSLRCITNAIHEKGGHFK